MPRPRGPHGRNDSTTVAVRVPNTLFARMQAAGGNSLAEWHRNVLRRACSVPLDYDAGYHEGRAAGWAEAQARLRDALKGA